MNILLVVIILYFRSTFASNVVELGDTSFDEILNGSKFWLVDFYAVSNAY